MIISQMAEALGLSITFVANLTKTASYEYKSYAIAKRDGGYRTICHPSRRLKALQRWLLLNVIDRLPVHNAAYAYRHGRSVFDNARVHASSRYLLRPVKRLRG